MNSEEIIDGALADYMNNPPVGAEWHETVSAKKESNDDVDTVEGVCNGFLPYTQFLGFLEFSGYHQWQQESQ